jgi:putative PIN family toxin of toxin-antitoxin system
VVLAWEAERFTALTSAGIIANLEAKLSLNRISRRFTIDTPAAIRWVEALLSSQTELVLVPVPERLPITGDPEDDYVLATGRIAHADFLVTGDKGLLALRRYGEMQIVSPRDFLERLETDENAK